MEESEIKKTENVSETEKPDDKRFDYSLVYDDTRYFIDGMIQQYNFYPEILQVLRNGDATIELKKRIMLRAIDETWVNIVEDSITALDEIIRKPSRFIQENEQVLPIELSRNISSRSIKHLAQHTDYISKIEDGMITPSKILNVFRDETIQTYENKFINTLINRLFIFVNRRYQIAKESGMDAKTTSIEFAENFEHGEVKGKIHFGIELEEPPKEGDVLKNYTYTTDLWRRVERLNSICLAYMNSDFVRNMEKNYIRPPVMRTNAILKNKNMRQCLALWEFIESYENAGYTSLVEEDLEDIDPGYIKDLYETMALEYLIFRHKVHGGFEEDDTLAHAGPDEPYSPEVIEDLVRAEDDEFDAHYESRIPMPNKQRDLTAMDRKILDAIDLALEADAAARSEDELFRSYLKKSFTAKLIQSDPPVQDYYSELKNELLSYKKVKARMSWDCESFNKGRTKCAKITIKGKTLVLYLSLSPSDYDQNKYHFTDASDKAKYEEVPMALKVRSARALKYAKELIAEMMYQLGIVKDEKAEVIDYHMPYESTKALIEKGLIKVIGNPDIPDDDRDLEELADPEDAEIDEEDKEDEESEEGLLFDSGMLRYRKSFTARLIQAGEPVQSFYTELKNELLSYKKVKSRISWGYESFNKGRIKCAKLVMRGKTLNIYLALDPNEYNAQKYHFSDASDVSKYAEVPLQLKVRSPRAVKYAKELIAEMMAKLGIPQGEVPTEDYRMPYEDNETLIGKGLIKIVGGDQPAEEPEEEAEVISEENAVAEIEENEPETEDEEEIASVGGIKVRYKKSFTAKLIQSGEPVQSFYTELKNELLSYKKVKNRISWDYETFNKGRIKCAKMLIRGKTLRIYLALDPKEYENTKYHFTDVSDTSKYAEVPMMVKIRSARAVKYAKELIAEMMAKLGIPQGEVPAEDYRMPYEDTETLIGKELIKVVGADYPSSNEEETDKEEMTEETVNEMPVEETPDEGNVSDDDENEGGFIGGIAVRYRKSFTAKIIQSDDEVKDYYSELKNELLSYKKVKNRISWDYETFNKGRTKCAKMLIRGKTLRIYLALDPKEYENTKYHFTDVSETSKYAEVPMLIKIRSARAVKYAKELIAEMMAKLEIPQGEVPTEDYRMPYEDTETLIGKELIKVVEGEQPVIIAAEKDFETGENPELITDTVPEPEINENETSDEENESEDEAFGFGKEGVSYRKSFEAKLILSDDEVKDYYSELKNELLSYKKVKNRISWDYETFNKGRTKCAKMLIRGKTLRIYLALDPKEYENTKYHFTDVSETSKYAEVPMLVKIRSARAVKYAKELIAEMMAKLEIPALEKQTEDYRPETKTLEELIELGLVKVAEQDNPFNTESEIVPEPENENTENVEEIHETEITSETETDVNDREIQESIEVTSEPEKIPDESEMTENVDTEKSETEPENVDITDNESENIEESGVTAELEDHEVPVAEVNEVSESEISENKENETSDNNENEEADEIPEENESEKESDEAPKEDSPKKQRFSLFRWLRNLGKK